MRPKIKAYRNSTSWGFIEFLRFAAASGNALANACITLIRFFVVVVNLIYFYLDFWNVMPSIFSHIQLGIASTFAGHLKSNFCFLAQKDLSLLGVISATNSE